MPRPASLTSSTQIGRHPRKSKQTLTEKVNHHEEIEGKKEDLSPYPMTKGAKRNPSEKDYLSRRVRQSAAKCNSFRVGVEKEGGTEGPALFPTAKNGSHH